MNTKEEFQLSRWIAEVDQVLKKTMKFKGGFLKWIATYEKEKNISAKNPHFFAKLVIDKFNLPIVYKEDDPDQLYESVEEENENHVNTFRRYASMIDLLYSFAMGYVTIRPTRDDLEKLNKSREDSLTGSDLRFTSSNFRIVIPENSGLRLISEIDGESIIREVDEIYVRVLRGNKAEHHVKATSNKVFDEVRHFVLHIILVDKDGASEKQKPHTEVTQELFIKIDIDTCLYMKACEVNTRSSGRFFVEHMPHDLLVIIFNLLYDLDKYSYRKPLETSHNVKNESK